MLEIIIGQALIALLIGAMVTTIWRHVEVGRHKLSKSETSEQDKVVIDARKTYTEDVNGKSY